MDSKAIPKTDGVWKFGISIQTGQNTVIEQVSWVIFTQKHVGPLCGESPEDYSDLPKEEPTLHILWPDWRKSKETTLGKMSSSKLNKQFRRLVVWNDPSLLTDARTLAIWREFFLKSLTTFISLSMEGKWKSQTWNLREMLESNMEFGWIWSISMIVLRSVFLTISDFYFLQLQT